MISILLGACASPQWTRADFNAAQRERDELACRAQTEREFSRQSAGFYGSPAELYGQNFRPSGRAPQWGGGLPGPMFDIDPVRRMLEEDRVTDACMRANGYTLEEPPLQPAPPKDPVRPAGEAQAARVLPRQKLEVQADAELVGIDRALAGRA